MGLGSNARSSHILKTHGFLGTNAHSPHIHKTQGFWGRTLKIEPLVEQFAQHLLQSCLFCFKSAASARGKGVCGGTMCMCIRFSRGVNILFMMRHGYIWCRCFCYRWTIQSSCRRCRYHCMPSSRRGRHRRRSRCRCSFSCEFTSKCHQMSWANFEAWANHAPPEHDVSLLLSKNGIYP